MKREDFKEILPIHIESCKKILAVQSKCWKEFIRIFENEVNQWLNY